MYFIYIYLTAVLHNYLVPAPMVILFPPSWLWFLWWCSSCLCSHRNIQANVEFSQKGGPEALGTGTAVLNGPTEIMWIIIVHLKNLLTLIKQPSAESNSWLWHKLIHKPICKFISSCLQFLKCFCRWCGEPVALLSIIYNSWARSYQLVIKTSVLTHTHTPFPERD